MLDRESTFAHPGIVAMLKSKMIPVAIDQAYQRRQKDAEGDFYRKIALQSPRNDFTNTTQGFYIADASGKLYSFNNNRDPEKLLRLLEQSQREFLQTPPKSVKVIGDSRRPDPRWNVSPPQDGLVLRVRAKILGGYEPTENRWQKIFQSALSRDNLWVTREEHQRLCMGEFPQSLARRIARFHLVDNTRGEPPMWRESEIQSLEITLNDEGKITGAVHLETASGDRGYQASLRGELVVTGGRVSAFTLVCAGDFWGEGPFTKNAPEGRFPLAIALTLADGSDAADRIPPQGSRGWVDGYLKQ